VEYYEISYPEIRNLFELARIGKRDTFLDLGSGKGLTVRLATSERKVKRSIGVEKNFQNYESAKGNAIRHLGKSQLMKLDLGSGI